MHFLSFTTCIDDCKDKGLTGSAFLNEAVSRVSLFSICRLLFSWRLIEIGNGISFSKSTDMNEIVCTDKNANGRRLTFCLENLMSCHFWIHVWACMHFRSLGEGFQENHFTVISPPKMLSTPIEPGKKGRKWPDRTSYSFAVQKSKSFECVSSSIDVLSVAKL